MAAFLYFPKLLDYFPSIRYNIICVKLKEDIVHECDYQNDSGCIDQW